ncbi:hypothetical protein CWR48_04220 [Oceanobacillus arenosus]|uniref:Uncharacterized protein n=1 Tax=Oceanobacillus arenosus TaxID=1229153 RepID=A0A3D8PYC6_9BACI|nr:hypothetical protein [Oceanobacillus arenosus]RDW21024.1 hypothetical protein CWR48_04220 [Oceanobacillus arenosus]
MDYQAFYTEVVNWINQVNQLATKYGGMESNDFWTWVTMSTGELCEKYNNNPIVIKQMVMLHEWLEEVYFGSKKS